MVRKICKTNKPLESTPDKFQKDDELPCRSSRSSDYYNKDPNKYKYCRGLPGPKGYDCPISYKCTPFTTLFIVPNTDNSNVSLLKSDNCSEIYYWPYNIKTTA